MYWLDSDCRWFSVLLAAVPIETPSGTHTPSARALVYEHPLCRATALAKAFSGLHALRHLDLGDCLLGSKGCTAILKVLQTEQQPLQVLNLEYNDANSNNEEGLMALVASKHTQFVKAGLLLNGNCLSEVRALSPFGGGPAQLCGDLTSRH